MITHIMIMNWVLKLEEESDSRKLKGNVVTLHELVLVLML